MSANQKPVSPARSAAARANGAKSRGPVTPEGKAISSQNAIRHGLAANSLVLTSESEPRFREMLAAYTDKFQPQDAVECDLVEQMASAQWRLQRMWSTETALFDLTMDRQAAELEQQFEAPVDGATRLALAFEQLAEQQPRSLPLLLRYEARLQATYTKASKHLLTLRQQAALLSPEHEPDDPAPCQCRTNPSRWQSNQHRRPSQPCRTNPSRSRSSSRKQPCRTNPSRCAVQS